MQKQDREIRVVMHDVKIRTLKVSKVKMLSRHLKKITFTGEELKDFVTLSPDDHIKAFFPYLGETRPVLPDDSDRTRPPIMRDYTPLKFSQEKGELEIIFYLNGKGPGAQWAKEAEIGESLIIGGPRGSRIVPYHFDWYLMIGDETSLPSFIRRLSEMPREKPTLVFLEVEDETEIISLGRNQSAHIFWLFRKDAMPEEDQIKKYISKITLPKGDPFVWISLEGKRTKSLKDFLLSKKNFKEEWMKAKAYWVQK